MRKYMIMIMKRISLAILMDLHILSLPEKKKNHTHAPKIRAWMVGWILFMFGM
jgi:hypothetical protein